MRLSLLAPKPSPICPVCLKEVPALVCHHDHFGDIVDRTIWAYFQSLNIEWDQYNIWLKKHGLPVPTYNLDDTTSQYATFKDTMICSLCNNICARMKRKYRGSKIHIPGWASFSPDDMKLLQDWPLTQGEQVWAERRALYGRHIAGIVEGGIPRDIMLKMWQSKNTTNSTGSQDKRKELKLKIAHSKFSIRKQINLHLENPNIIPLMIFVSQLNWPRDLINNLIFYHHKLNGFTVKDARGGLSENGYLTILICIGLGKINDAIEHLNYRLQWVSNYDGAVLNFRDKVRSLRK